MAALTRRQELTAETNLQNPLSDDLYDPERLSTVHQCVGRDLGFKDHGSFSSRTGFKLNIFILNYYFYTLLVFITAFSIWFASSIIFEIFWPALFAFDSHGQSKLSPNGCQVER